MELNCDPLHIIKNGIDCEGDTREEYMEKLRKWCNDAIEHNKKMFELWQTYYIQAQAYSEENNPSNNTTPNPANQPPNVTATSPAVGNGYFVYTLPPMWKRFLAEIIDFLILFFIKILLTIILIDSFQLIDIENYTLSAFEDRLRNPEVVTKLTMEIFIVEILHRIVVCFYEAYSLALDGTTPGKKVMGLAVIQAFTIMPSPDNADRMIVYPCSLLSFKDALLRAILKNVFISLLFPVSFLLFFFKFRCTAYDLLTNSLVVEQDPNAPPFN